MTISQASAGAAVTASGTFPVDRFRLAFSMDGACSVQQVAEAPAGFVNSLKFTTVTADTNLGTSQTVLIGQRIEGLNVADLGWGSANAQPVTLSFWVRSSLTGTFGGSVENSAENRSYPFAYTISAANTWEYKTITIAGDTTGTWLTTNGIGIRVTFSMGAGSNFVGTAGAWAAADYISSTGATSVIGTLNATWQITGVQLEEGTAASPFENRLYGQELILCQRYFTNFTASSSYIYIAQAYSATAARTQVIPFKVSMRATPTITLGTAGTSSGQSAFLRADNGNPTVGSNSVASITTEQFIIFGSGYSGTSWSAGTATSFYVEGTQTVWASSAEL
jgi:hypothetical protein